MTNDAFASAVPVVMTDGTFVHTADASSATTEVDEPLTNLTYPSNVPARTVWYSYNSVVDQTLRIQTYGSTTNYGSANTLVTIYQGSSLATLTVVNQDPDNMYPSDFFTELLAGEDYYIQVGVIGSGLTTVNYTVTFTTDYVPDPSEFTLTATFDEDRDYLIDTPAFLNILVGNGAADEPIYVDLLINGDYDSVCEGVLDEFGRSTVPVPIPALYAGDYLLRVRGDTSNSTTLTYTILKDSIAWGREDLEGDNSNLPHVPELPVGNGAWRLFDSLPNRERIWEFPRNPSRWSNPLKPNFLEHDVTSAPDGNILAWEGAEKPWTFEFSGYLDTREEYEELTYWANMRHRFWLVDHRDRIHYVTFEHFDAKARIVPNKPWAHDYTIRVIHFYEQDLALVSPTVGGTSASPGSLYVWTSSPATYLADMTSNGSGYEVYWTITPRRGCNLVLDTSASGAGGIALEVRNVAGQVVASSDLIASDGFPSLTFEVFPDLPYTVKLSVGSDISADSPYVVSATTTGLFQSSDAGESTWETASELPIDSTPSTTYAPLRLRGTSRPYWAAWWKFTPATDLTITFDTAPSAGEPDGNEDTYIKVYSGFDYADRVVVAEADDTLTELTASVTFAALAGVTYRLQVGCYSATEHLPITYDLNIDWGTTP